MQRGTIWSQRKLLGVPRRSKLQIGAVFYEILAELSPQRAFPNIRLVQATTSGDYLTPGVPALVEAPIMATVSGRDARSKNARVPAKESVIAGESCPR